MKAWRDSASLILAACHGQKCGRTVSPAIHNYNLLFLKRHQNSSFMPGTYVFPGGTVDPADSDLKWRELFTTCGFNNGNFATLIPKVAIRPPIFQSKQNELPKEISLRITAIRETFEECGVLLCRRKKDNHALSNWAQHMSIPKDELQTWQDKVHKNATEFLTFCKKFECYPDLWALHEWGNWLTPTVYPKKRFDTVFYLACMPSTPDAEHEASEIEELKWETPENFFSSSMDIPLPPPQRYEIATLNKFKNIDTLLDFGMKRNKEGVQLYLPVCILVKDGTVMVLPGDTMYPKEVSLVDRQIIDKSDVTMDEFRKMTPIKNRMELHDIQMTVVTDIVHEDSHTAFSTQKASDGKPKIKNKL